MIDYSTIADAVLLSWYNESLQALQNLRSGQQVVSASYSAGSGSQSVGYSAANIGDLRQQIAALAAALYARGLLAAPTRRRAIGIRY